MEGVGGAGLELLSHFGKMGGGLFLNDFGGGSFEKIKHKKMSTKK